MGDSYTATIEVAADAKRAFDAINDVSGWWGRITGSTAAVGDEFVYIVPGLHYSGFRVVDRVPESTIAWQVTGSFVDFADDKSEWTGTTVRFDIEETPGGARVVFTHEGLAPEIECYDVCSSAWRMFIVGSLKSFIETGRGAPYEFTGAEELTEAEHSELHREAAASARAV
ncbi:hypothetical protein LK09_03740 [Microbacterium mangrovi]|uniref:ATPase n=1 Tax=Microbacterium mangrovi TaxID=1348253 RepID=A0A0B2ABX8_9MICO|nr:SRPBCC domain-containing protein [Microbacterium mangrovi]KHK99136.1 hypothetical protein LK09_03740 [Microbacterium mangrovi]